MSEMSKMLSMHFPYKRDKKEDVQISGSEFYQVY